MPGDTAADAPTSSFNDFSKFTTRDEITSICMERSWTLSLTNPAKQRYRKLGLQEIIHLNTGLFQNRSQSAFGDIAWVIRNRGVAIHAGVVPNLMAASGLPIELEAAQP